MAGFRRPVEDRRGVVVDERGAAALEFSLVAMLLVTLVFGIAEFGWMWYQQSSLASAARDGARTMAIESQKSGNGAADVRTAVESQVENVFIGDDTVVEITPEPAGWVCASGGSARISLSYPAGSLTGFFGEITLTGEGKMRCGG